MTVELNSAVHSDVQMPHWFSIWYLIPLFFCGGFFCMDSFCRGVAWLLVVAVTSFNVSQGMVTEEGW